jgi:hypothetical protein
VVVERPLRISRESNAAFGGSTSVNMDLRRQSRTVVAQPWGLSCFNDGFAFAEVRFWFSLSSAASFRLSTYCRTPFRRLVYLFFFVSHLQNVCLVPKEKSIRARSVEPDLLVVG